MERVPRLKVIALKIEGHQMAVSLLTLHVPKVSADDFPIVARLEHHKPRHAQLAGERLAGKRLDAAERMALHKVCIELQPTLQSGFVKIVLAADSDLLQTTPGVVAVMIGHCRRFREVHNKMVLEVRDPFETCAQRSRRDGCEWVGDERNTYEPAALGLQVFAQVRPVVAYKQRIRPHRIPKRTPGDGALEKPSVALRQMQRCSEFPQRLHVERTRVAQTHRRPPVPAGCRPGAATSGTGVRVAARGGHSGSNSQRIARIVRRNEGHVFGKNR